MHLKSLYLAKDGSKLERSLHIYICIHIYIYVCVCVSVSVCVCVCVLYVITFASNTIKDRLLALFEDFRLG